MEELERDVEMQTVLLNAVKPYELEREGRGCCWRRAFDYEDLVERYEADKVELQARQAVTEQVAKEV